MIFPDLQEEVHNCIKCGLCINSCPVYKQLFTEGASPRGKVQLIKKILEGQLEPSENFHRLLLTCLLCETCTVQCPSGLQVDRLMKAMRAEMLQKFSLGWQKKLLFSLLSSRRLLPFFVFWGRTLGNPLLSLLPGEGRVGTIPYSKLPKLNSRPFRSQHPETIPGPGPAGRVLYFTGCATQYLFENVGHSVISVLERLGVEILLPADQVCCGLPIFLSGARKTALQNIRKNLEILNRQEVDAIVVDCATCGAALKKEYAHLLEEMGEDGGPARATGKKVQDISQYLLRFDLKNILHPLREKVTYHDPCHLLRSQGVKEEPRRLLASIPGLELAEMAGADVCCGGGGTFQWEHPDIASGITARKVQSIRETGAAVVASGCPGCRLQIHGSLGEAPVRVLHPVELVARALS